MAWAAVLAYALVVFSASSAMAQFKVPPLTGPVVDQAGILDPATERAIDGALRAVRNQGGSQMNVLTVSSLNGLTIEQASIQVADQWKLGGAELDNGVLLLVAPKERSVRIEVGQGREGVLTDVESKRIIEDSIIPLFRAGDYPSGVLVGVYQILRKTDPNIDVTPYFEGREVSSARGTGPGGKKIPVALIIGVLWFLLMIGGGGGRRRRHMGWAAPIILGGMGGGRRGGGGFGGGGWSGGGGGFSGGGASGSW